MQLKAPEGVKSVAVGGKQYAVDRLGVVDVPGEAVEQVQAHGFTPYIPPPPEVEPVEPDTAKRPYHRKG